MKWIAIMETDYVYLNNTKVHTKIFLWIKYLCLRDIIREIDPMFQFNYDFYISHNQKKLFPSENIAWKNQMMNYVSEKWFKRLIKLYMWEHKNKELLDKQKILWNKNLLFPKIRLFEISLK